MRERSMDVVRKHVIKEIQMESGIIFAELGELRKVLAGCVPLVRIYRQDNPINIMGRTSYALKSYHIALVLCRQPQFVDGMDFSMIPKITRYRMSAEVTNKDGFVENFIFTDLFPENIDPRGEWVFTLDPSKELLDKMLALKTVDGEF